MAELALGILGLTLAWKGIVDFGSLITDLVDDDAKCRETQLIELEVSQLVLKDWGTRWGINRDDGDFHNFDAERKEVIGRIIFRLAESRVQALDKLRSYYGLSTDHAADTPTRTEKRLARLLQKIKSSANRAREKVVWVTHEKAVLEHLVEETTKMQEHLRHVTYDSDKFIHQILLSLRDAPSLQNWLTRVESRGRELLQKSARNWPSPSSPGEDEEQLDGQTLVSYATRSIASSKQVDHVQHQIDRGFACLGDDRIPRAISLWWADGVSSILLLEGSDIPEDETIVSTCALVFYFTTCHKLIYLFQPETTIQSASQFVDMLRTFNRSLMTLPGHDSLAHFQLAKTVSEMEKDPVEPGMVEQLIELFYKLLKDLITTSSQRTLIILGGLEYVITDDSNSVLAIQVRTFVSGLRSLCEPRSGNGYGVLKVLFGCKGHASALYRCVGDQDVEDFTSRPTSEVNLFQELALRIQDLAI
ncbi:hypothetical protein GQ53DRAFT_756272 [Thozetella sp. PMI_491]|nr:hypothetical protein GQ53DRAFT_756272 [Thozetella sp. PMI_491]